jgi:hypothetical protein
MVWVRDKKKGDIAITLFSNNPNFFNLRLAPTIWFGLWEPLYEFQHFQKP